MSDGETKGARGVLIEQWFPVETIRAESMRERGASSALPPLYFLHIWWARRPLLTSRASILASVLPAYGPDWPEKLKKRFPTEESYHQWFLKACGIFGDPVAGRKLIAWANQRGITLSTPPYAHPRAFTVSPSSEVLDVLDEICELTWGKKKLSALDPFSGGGSIPFEAMRYGFDTTANELNPVANVVLRATLQLPVQFGETLVADLKLWGTELAKRVEKRLAPYFPKAQDETIHAYIWARTVPCPYTGKPIPLLPNWWLIKEGATPVAVKASFGPKMSRARFEIVTGKKACAALIAVGISSWAVPFSIPC